MADIPSTSEHEHLDIARLRVLFMALPLLQNVNVPLGAKGILETLRFTSVS
jgi:hypothetical protein